MNRFTKSIIFGGLSLLCGFGYIYQCDNRINVTRYVHYTNNERIEYNGLKILQISDLHEKEFGKNNKNLIKKVKKELPDIIVTTGDMIDTPNYANVLNLFNELKQIAPTYYVNGNHENSLSSKTLEKFYKDLENNGIIVLRNKWETITIDGHEPINLIGLFDENYKDKTLHNIMETITNSYMNVLLTHRPNGFETNYSIEDIDIVFCGHTHGGQWRIPFIGGAYAPDQGIRPKYDSGRFDLNDTTMYLSRGLGNQVIYPRFNNNPQIITVSIW